MSQVRILVLTSSTGGGHDARAQAFAEWVFNLYRHAVDVRIEHVLEDSSLVGRTGVNLYNWLQRRAPWLHHPYYMLIEGLSILNQQTVSFGKRFYVRLLEEYQPHLIFSVHDCLNRGYFEVARRVLGRERVRCATYCGEFSGGYGYSRNWVDKSVDLFFSRTPTASDFAQKLGLRREQLRVRGHLMRPKAHEETFTAEERKRYLEHRLGLRSGCFTVFLATGGNGANNHMELLPVIAEFGDRAQAIVVCGRNQQTYAEAIHWRAQHPEIGCFIDGYSDDMHLLTQVSDTIVTRGGTTTCAQALHFRCPIIFNAFGGVMPQESLTVKYFKRGDACALIDSPNALREVLRRWLDDPPTYRKVNDNVAALRYDENPRLLIQELVGLAYAAAGKALPQPAGPA